MKLSIAVIVGASMVLSGLPSAFGISLLRSKVPSVNQWPYSFGDRYIYDNEFVNGNLAYIHHPRSIVRVSYVEAML